MVLACFLNNLIFQAMWANGLYKAFLRYSVAFTLAMVGMQVVGTLLAGATGAAWANVAAGAADFALFPLFALRLLGVPWRPAISPLWRPLAASVPAAVTALVVNHFLPATRIGDLLHIVIVVVVGSLGYLAILMLIWRPVLMAVMRHVFNALGMKRR
jgi:hypothetical protein